MMLASWLKSAALGLMVAMLPLVQAAAREVPRPVIEKGMGDKCVEDTEYMRRNHMELLYHHRDKTMREGIRTKRHSLKGCIACHATPDASGQRTVLGKGHFCQSCHTYAAVTIDCFQCHSSKPESASTQPAQDSRAKQTVASMHQIAGMEPNTNPGLSVKDLAGVIK